MPGIIIPFYAYPKLWLPANEWARLAAAARQRPSVDIRAVINPANGPGSGSGPDFDNYAGGIRLLRQAGISVVGYVATNYAAMPQAEVAAEIHSYRQLFPGLISGIYFDEMAHSPGHESYYSKATTAAIKSGLTYTIGNPGALLPASYAGSCTILNVYENTGYPKLPGALAGLRSNERYGRRESYSVLAYNVDRLDKAWIQEISDYVGYVYVAGHGEERDWDCLPPFFEQFVEQMGLLA